MANNKDEWDGKAKPLDYVSSTEIDGDLSITRPKEVDAVEVPVTQTEEFGKNPFKTVFDGERLHLEAMYIENLGCLIRTRGSSTFDGSMTEALEFVKDAALTELADGSVTLHKGNTNRR